VSNGDESRWRIPPMRYLDPRFYPWPTSDSPNEAGNVASRVRSDGVRQAGALSLPKRRGLARSSPAQSACGPALPDFFVSRHPMAQLPSRRGRANNDRVSLVRLGRPSQPR
jgi:hypothetical protein